MLQEVCQRYSRTRRIRRSRFHRHSVDGDSCCTPVASGAGERLEDILYRYGVDEAFGLAAALAGLRQIAECAAYHLPNADLLVQPCWDSSASLVSQNLSEFDLRLKDLDLFRTNDDTPQVSGSQQAKPYSSPNLIHK